MRVTAIRSALAAMASAVVLAAAGCGGGDEATSTTSTSTATGATGSTGDTGATGSAGSGASVASVGSAEEFVECLDGEGLTAVDGGEVLGLEGQEVVDLALNGSDQAAVFVIFGSAEEAAADVETTGTLAGVASPEARGNVVFGFDSTADETAAEQAAVDACLPPAEDGGSGAG